MNLSSRPGSAPTGSARTGSARSGSPRDGARRGVPSRVGATLAGAGALLVLLLPGGAAPAAAQGGGGAGEALEVLEAAAERFAGLEGFCARFDQTVQNELLRRTFESHGELCQARPDRFAMHFSDPAGDRVVADGSDIWVYFPSTDPGQAFRSPASAAEGRFDLHREFLSDPGDRYAPTLEGVETVSGRASYRVGLEPLQPSPYLRARIWVGVDDPLIHRVEITEEDGLVRTLDLSQMRLNPAIPAGTFEFEPPEGVQVIVR